MLPTTTCSRYSSVELGLQTAALGQLGPGMIQWYVDLPCIPDVDVASAQKLDALPTTYLR